MSPKRVILVIIDACGVGELPDADKYGDSGAATLPNIAAAVGGLNMPACQKLGLGNIASIAGIAPADQPLGCFGRMAEKSPGKDSTTGHWELGGVILSRPLPLFPDGFPSDLVAQFENRAGVKVIGNVPASGTAIIDELGNRHLETGELILYTSADSVFQLAAHEEIIPLEKLYEICSIARELLSGEYAVARVIARPFIGKPGRFKRTSGRKDFSLLPPGETILDRMVAEGLSTLAVGKIFDLFARKGFTSRTEAKSNSDVMTEVTRAAKDDSQHRLIFANCVDFDMLWGHRNDVTGFARGLEQFDRDLEKLISALREDDLLLVTADHGCDPTIKTSTDHTREYVPILTYGMNLNCGISLGTRDTFADVAATVAELFGLPARFPGESFLRDIISQGT
ncbi:MAG: phosphopentomutase [Candidatus Zixiibacteriota bacterium]|nr:MAG: phosphopentomutase [candidate division Zixibacteria bacterium]